ncbi:type II toxin-antitoxin system RelE/ParE family toxin [Patescibacteria group bacterium]|nr:type II toxin-antitoxin system RelE/ParE family toxin [Patescibacteria group bacterium]MBU1703370.1 type II toxin-antitoxin system RelE/ParE family toxin [Patescibacteria group bacterium]MBU1954071.1 type II toxin-antitoxin system RelE/ParE family toxin [Patescibacteria group bacterium]
MHNYIFHDQVQKFLKKQNREFLINFQDKLTILCRNPMTRTLDIKPLIGLKACYRLRIGKYRFLYEIRPAEAMIIFFKAGARGDIYK